MVMKLKENSLKDYHLMKMMEIRIKVPQKVIYNKVNNKSLTI